MDHLGELIFALIVIVGLAFGIWCLIMYIKAPSEMTHCYIEHIPSTDTSYSLKSALIMQPDETIGRFKTLEEAVESAKKIGCELK